MLTSEQQKNAKKLQSLVVTKINDTTHHLTTLYNVCHLSYEDLKEIYHTINAIVMFNNIPLHQHLSHKTKQVLVNAGVYETINDDTLITYYIVNQTLNMSKGKIGVQTARAGQVMFLNELKYDDSLLLDSLEELYEHSAMKGNKSICLKANQNQMDKILNGDIEQQLAKIAKDSDCPIRIYPVYDSGMTEVQENSLTVIGITPVPQSIIKPITRKFQLL